MAIADPDCYAATTCCSVCLLLSGCHVVCLLCDAHRPARFTATLSDQAPHPLLCCCSDGIACRLVCSTWVDGCSAA
jgi:hypothetical protein